MSSSEIAEFYRLWVARDEWTQTEAACLIAGVDPSEEISTYDNDRQELISTIFQNEKIIRKNLIVQNLKTITTWAYAFKYEDRNMSPFFYINKAIASDMIIPDTLQELIKVKFIRHTHLDHEIRVKYPILAATFLQEKEDMDIEKPKLHKLIEAISDKKHADFSLELYTAVLAWAELFGDTNGATLKKSVGENVKVFLARQGLEPTSDAVIKRIAKVITPPRLKTKRGSGASLNYKK